MISLSGFKTAIMRARESFKSSRMQYSSMAESTEEFAFETPTNSTKRLMDSGV